MLPLHFNIPHALSILLLLLLMDNRAWGQDTSQIVHHQQVMFWNVENAFWPADDPEKLDDDFTPAGMRRWTRTRLHQKLIQLERGILAAGNGRPPMIVGLAEVEGDSVMRYWTRSTPLYKLGYKYLLSDRADSRGIMTALLYQPADYHLLHYESFTIDLPHGHRATRQLLHAVGTVVSRDTLDLIIAHLPSQYSGARQSADARQAAHITLMHVADSITNARAHPYIIIMGDMNEAPTPRHQWWSQTSHHQWQNLMLPLQQALLRHPAAYGSHKYQGEWSFLDQFIVTPSLLTGGSSATLQCSNARSFALPFMLIDDATHLGHRPRRSYHGSNYEAGLSDHLPIVLDLDIRF